MSQRLNAKFWPLFWTQFLGALNDNVLKNAMVIMITYKGLSVAGLDAAAIVALSGGIFILPFFLFSMAAGQIADKHEKSRLVRLVKVWELAITLVASFGFLTHNVYLLLGALFMMGTHSTFFGPIKYSAIPELVEDKQLVTGNAYVEMGTFIAILLGTIGGGFVISLPHGEIAASIAVNGLAIMGIITSFKLVRLPSSAKNLKVSFSPIKPVIETLEFLRIKPEMISSIMAISWFWFFGAAVLSVLPPYCKDYLRVDEHVITAFLAMYTLGIGLGSFICERLSKGRAELRLVPPAAIGMAVFLLDICFVNTDAHGGLMNLFEFLHKTYAVRLLIDFFLMSVAGGIFVLPLYTILQERSEKEYRSRVIAGNNVYNAIFMVVSAVMVMALHMLGYTQPDTLMVLVALHVAFCGYIFWKVPAFLGK